ncbi:DUF3784 domain-containing protein [Namhaeicola litoreus]|uniref:DUF3784 domain-containing protein n=1 Tax=Namhaeicola litoreus TaxID=1052145 RepID=A0ABW3Y2R2_9FLAO
MIWIILGLSLLFMAIGFLINEKNAINLLAGYNTMSVEQRKNFDLHGYLTLFKKFHIFLGISFLVFGLILYFLGEETALVAFISIYPISAYLIFIFIGFRFDNNPKNLKRYASVIVVVVSLLLVVYMMFEGMKENELVFSDDNISIEGMYGDDILYAEIAVIKLVDQLPKIVKKSNGFAAGEVRKGYFKTDQDEKVKLILNGDQIPIIYIQKRDSTKLYFSSSSTDNLGLFQTLEKQIHVKKE